MAGACATISARQLGAHPTMGELVVSANATSAHDSNSARQTKNLLTCNWLNASLSGQRSSFPYFQFCGKQFLDAAHWVPPPRNFKIWLVFFLFEGIL